MSTTLSEQEKQRILSKLDEMEQKIDAIQKDLNVLLEIHEMLHPEELEKARQRVEDSGE